MNPATFEGRNELAKLALVAARDAGILLRRGWRTAVSVEHKGRADLVTEYDRASERLLREHLAPTRLPFVGEETGGSRHDSSAQGTWFVDPLDGTTNFVHGHPYFCVSVGLVVGNSPVLGVVVAPALSLEWVGVIEGQVVNGRVAEGARTVAQRNEEPCHVSKTSSLQDALLATGFPYDVHSSDDNNLANFGSVIKKCRAIRRCGAAAIDLCHVAEGTFDGYWERKLKPWDVAAGAAIVLAAGGQVTAQDGGPIDLESGHLVASNGRIHNALASELGRVMATSTV